MTTTSDNGNARIFKTRSLCRRLTDSMGWRVLVLGALVTALAASVGLALS
jgi:hypothetical protein